jgi:hypothetical protein
MQFFPIFAYFLTNQTTEPILIGALRDPTDADLADGLAIAVYKNSETETILDQGYEGQYRLRVDFSYTIAIYSRVSDADCNERAITFLGALKPGVDIHLTYDASTYAMYINKVEDKTEYRPDTNMWAQTLTFDGFVYLKLI